uniref:hypothetical protein n=1 Tax=Flavobacterium sp. TaxID=239 RepID=UPI0040490737
MNKLKSKIITIGIFFMLISCTTYTIPIDSFRSQMVDANSKTMKSVRAVNPFQYANTTYLSNNIEKLTVWDNKGIKTYLKNSPRLEMRVTHRNGKKFNFYFDTVILENDSIKGHRSRFFKKLTRSIPMDSIRKIEIQDGGKNYSYKN